MSDTLPCGHPAACLGPECDAECRWCEEVRTRDAMIASLRSVLHGKAVVVNGGAPTMDISPLMQQGRWIPCRTPSDRMAAG